MIDPINPNQNQQNQVTKPGPVQPQAPVQVPTPANDQQVFNSVNVGASSAKPELGPVGDANFSENQSVEDQPMVEQSGEFTSPAVGGEVKDMIKVKKDFPELDRAAKNAGVTETVPSGPVYNNLPQDLQSAQLQYNEKPVTSSDKWRALEAIKNFSRNLIGQPKPNEA